MSDKQVRMPGAEIAAAGAAGARGLPGPDEPRGGQTMKAVGVYERRVPRRALPLSLVIGLLAAVIISGFLLARFLFQ
ncbi:MAG TPA: hypothetical protein VF723_11895 [Pyrinomonadaceae bacterium]|jgi:hypothetical protein